MQSQTHVNILATRYIELLEIEIKQLKSTAATTPVRPFQSNCNLTDVSKAIQATGISVRTWAINHGFSYDTVRAVTCGLSNHKGIRAALIEEGFLEG